MLKFDFEVGEMKPDSQGWMEFFKSEAVAGPLREKCEAIAKAACDASSPDKMDKPPFVGDVRIGDKTALGVVKAATPHGFHAKERIIDNVGAGG